jgi:CysZ protein
LLKEIIIALQSYAKAHHFITRHKLWKWILIPGILYTLLFTAGLIFFLDSSSQAVTSLSRFIGIERWLNHQHNAGLSFLFMMGRIMVQLVLLFFYFSLFKYLVLILGSPVFAYLSQRTEALINGKEYTFRTDLVLHDMRRGIRLAIRNCLWQTVYLVSILILSLFPVAGWITPVICIFVESYYYGFSMLDYSCQRHNLTFPASIAYIGQHKGLAIGNGLVFYGMHFVPVVGWVLAPSYAVIAATISLYHQNLE